MKMTNIMFSILIAGSLIGSNQAMAKTKRHTFETILTKNKKDASNPYYKVKLDSIHELTSEEALMYELDLQDSHDKSMGQPSLVIKSNGFKIPNGVPGVADGGFTGGNSSVSEVNPSDTQNTAPNASNSNTNTNTNNNSNGTTVNKGGPAVNGGLTVGTGAGGNAPTGGLGKVTSTLDGVIMIIDKLIAIGEKIIPTIEKGRPAVTNKPMAAISVIPKIDAQDPVVHEMGDWSIPVTKHYKITYSNGLGSQVVSFVYSVTFQYGGTYGGKGKYLAGVRVAARDIRVDWGFDLDATSQLIQISNVGTAQNVIAGATMEITYTVKNVMRNLTTAESFFVAGDGRIYKLD